MIESKAAYQPQRGKSTPARLFPFCRGLRNICPVLSIVHAKTLEEAIEMLNRSAYGNMACLFTGSSAARQFPNETNVGYVGINLGVAAPMAYRVEGQLLQIFVDRTGGGLYF